MKQLLFVFFITVFTLFAKAQNPCFEKSLDSVNRLFTKVEIQPRYAGGDANLRKFILTKLDFYSITDTLKIKFVITQLRKMVFLSVENSNYPVVKQEIEKAIIASACNWLPGEISGRGVTSWCTKYIIYSSDDSKYASSVKIEIRNSLVF